MHKKVANGDFSLLSPRPLVPSSSSNLENAAPLKIPILNSTRDINNMAYIHDSQWLVRVMKRVDFF